MCKCGRNRKLGFESRIRKDPEKPFRVSMAGWLNDVLKRAEKNAMPISREFAYRMVYECIRQRDLETGRRVQSLISQNGLDSVSVLIDPLIRLFASCGSLADARQAFRKVSNPTLYTWNAIIDAHSKLGKGKTALKLYEKMQQKGSKPNEFIISTILKTCGSLGAIDEGKRIHLQVKKNGFQTDVVVGNALVDMYVKCGSLDDAFEVFDKLRNRNVITWSTMIAGYAHYGQGALALQCFERMQKQGIKPDAFTFSNILKACSSTGAIDQGKRVHEQIIRSKLKRDYVLESALVDMYAKCGNLRKARKIFNTLSSKNVVIWGAMIAGYSQLGGIKVAVKCFDLMQSSGVLPNDVVFLALLTGFCRAGLVDEGLRVYRGMQEYHELRPNISHVTCMMDLLGHAGCFNEVEDVLKTTVKLDVYLWSTLLDACRMHSNVELGQRCFNEIVFLDPSYAPAYILMSNIYASLHMRENDELHKLRKNVDKQKALGSTWIEVNGEMHEFVAGDEAHPRINEVYFMLKKLIQQFKNKGYPSKGSLIPMKVSNHEGEDLLCGHSERLAIAFGLLSMPFEKVIMVEKSLKMCSDCHEIVKRISKMVSRQIIVKSASFIHHFKDGECSCRNYIDHYAA